jgi:hypothetical protein
MSRAGRRTVTDPNPPLIPGQRPNPPSELNAAQQAIWTSIVGRLPVGWFTGENLPMLRELARHIDFANSLAADSEEARASPGDPKDMLALLKAHGYQTERIGNLSTKLRLTKASRFTRDAEAAAIAARNAPDGVNPWEDWGSGLFAVRNRESTARGHRTRLISKIPRALVHAESVASQADQGVRIRSAAAAHRADRAADVRAPRRQLSAATRFAQRLPGTLRA